MSLTLYTSGSTKDPKQVYHADINKHIARSLKETRLSSSDIVLDVFPNNVIAHYTITAQPALAVSAHLISANFEPYSYIKLFKEFQPTFISLIPRHIEILEKTKEWEDLDMRCVRYMVTGSQSIKQSLIDNLRKKGIQTVANWYGMTEMPPPVLVGYNSESFDFSMTNGYNVEFTDQGECVIDGFYTEDLFDLKNNTFLKRKLTPALSTWKNNV